MFQILPEVSKRTGKSSRNTANKRGNYSGHNYPSGVEIVPRKRNGVAT
jgi:hypothetical protein